jgi:NitT/TauT family transport system substrate-binding protein/putative hydroxymethylpyrimidine transport system substrate-binding protein
VHAPVYAAAGEHDLELVKPGPSPDSLKLVLGGRADVGLIDIHDFGLALEKGRDVVAIASLVRRPLAALAVAPEIRRPADLEGKRVGVSGLPSDPAFVRAMMEADGGDFSEAHLVTIGFAAVPQLLQGNVDAVPVFWNAEGVALRERGWKGRLLKIDDYGAPPYPEVVVFTTRKRLEERRGAMEDLVGALDRGIEKVRSDPGALAREIAEAGDAPVPLVRAQLDALLEPELLYGTLLDRTTIASWADYDAEIGILARRPDVDDAFAYELGR